ncbi:50S ribosomal protein L23 [Candidatus Parcubacteria bacterium]|nr:50S ribosomal protein L23 [Candidatus Parcubacteria bacterium]
MADKKTKNTSAKKEDSKEVKSKTVLLGARMTEKAALMAEKSHIYVFNVLPTATKKGVSVSIKNQYKVTPKSVHLARVPKKPVFIRGKWGVKGGGKKAYVYLKEGDKIDVI